MREFGEYLSELRSRLQVGPRRAQEICEETRCHLEAQAQRFEQQGLSSEAAAAKAIEAFGEPAAVAPLLTKANAQHHRVQVVQAVGLGALIGSCLWYLGATGSAVENPLAVRALQLYGAEAAVCGSTFGGLCGLLMGAWQVRLRWILAPFAAAPVAFLACRIYILSRPGASVDDALALPRGFGFALFVWAAIPIAVAWAVHRWVPRAPMEPASAE